MLVENHPFRPNMRALKAGARTVLMSVCPVLKSFSGNRHVVLLRERLKRGDIHAQVWRAVAIGDAAVIAAHAYSMEGAIEG